MSIVYIYLLSNPVWAKISAIYFFNKIRPVRSFMIRGGKDSGINFLSVSSNKLGITEVGGTSLPIY